MHDEQPVVKAACYGIPLISRERRDLGTVKEISFSVKGTTHSPQFLEERKMRFTANPER